MSAAGEQAFKVAAWLLVVAFILALLAGVIGIGLVIVSGLQALAEMLG